MNIEEFKQWWNRFEYSGNFPEPKAEHINLLLAELTRLTAELEESPYYVSLRDRMYDYQREAKQLKAALAEKDAEIERLKSEIEGDHVVYADLEESHRVVNQQLRIEGKRSQDMADLAASRLADQEAIERHVTKRVAGECAEIAEAMWSDHYWAWPAMQTYAAEIRKKYGVTE